MQKIIEVNNLNKHYKDNHIIKNANLTLKKGSIYGFIGQNGSGKTTIIRLILGLAFPDEKNSIAIFGETEEKMLVKMRKDIDGVIENPAFYPDFTARQNLEMKCLFLGIKESNKKIEELLKLVELDNAGKKKVKDFSLGMKQRLAIASSLINNPKILILDEPTNGLDPAGIKKIRELLVRLNKEMGITILVSSHILAELKKFVTDYIVIKDGSVIDEFKSQDLDKRFVKVLKIKAKPKNKALKILNDSNYSNVNVEGDHIILTPTKNIGEINRTLVENGVTVSEFVIKNKDAEDYFMSLMGGSKDV